MSAEDVVRHEVACPVCEHQKFHTPKDQWRDMRNDSTQPDSMSPWASEDNRQRLTRKPGDFVPLRQSLNSAEPQTHTYYRGLTMSGKGSESVNWDDDDSVLDHLQTRNNRYVNKDMRAHPNGSLYGNCWTTAHHIAHKFSINTFHNMGRRQVPQDRSKPIYGAVLEAHTSKEHPEDEMKKGYGESERKVTTEGVQRLTLHLHRLDPEHHHGAQPEQTHVRSIDVPPHRYQPTHEERIAYHKGQAKYHREFLRDGYGDPDFHQRGIAHHTEQVKLLKQGSAVHVGWLPWLHPDLERLVAQGAVRTPPGPNGDDTDPDPGIMIAVVPPKRVVKNLPIPDGGEHPDNIHVTLAYLGRTAEHTPEQVRDLPELIEAWAETEFRLQARVQGAGTFVNEGSHVLWASVDVPGLAQMHVRLVDYLDSHGFTVADDHGFTPHMTLSYEKHHVRFIPKVEPAEFTIRDVWCCIGGRWESFPLKGQRA